MTVRDVLQIVWNRVEDPYSAPYGMENWIHSDSTAAKLYRQIALMCYPNLIEWYCANRSVKGALTRRIDVDTPLEATLETWPELKQPVTVVLLLGPTQK